MNYQRLLQSMKSDKNTDHMSLTDLKKIVDDNYDRYTAACNARMEASESLSAAEKVCNTARENLKSSEKIYEKKIHSRTYRK